MNLSLLLLCAIVALSSCASGPEDAPEPSQNVDRVTQPNLMWKGGLEVLHVHSQAPRSGPLFTSLFLLEDYAVLRLGRKQGDWDSTLRLEFMYRTPHYVSLGTLADTGGYTEEVVVSIAPLSSGDAEVSFLRTVNNYLREDTHERRTFSVYAKGRLNSAKPDDEDLAL